VTAIDRSRGIAPFGNPAGPVSEMAVAGDGYFLITREE